MTDGGVEHRERTEEQDEDGGVYRGLDPVDMSGTATIDMLDRVDEVMDEELPRHQERLAEAEEALEGESDLTTRERREVSNLIAEIEEDIDALRHTARVFATRADEWGGSEFEVKKTLAFHEVQRASDDIASMTVRSGEPKEAAGAKDGAYQMKVLQQAIESSPPGAPGVTNDGFDWQIGQWLYERFEAVNSRGSGASPGN